MKITLRTAEIKYKSHHHGMERADSKLTLLQVVNVPLYSRYATSLAVCVFEFEAIMSHGQNISSQSTAMEADLNVHVRS